ncbi:Translation initiation factor eIF-2B subunit beta [Quillaja saponaria]|uniref:Translation initiation factor eIF2B subunit beta n=1 Tax=Quillaja saponaria TaxID=32244 RepID=A0AAD7VL11_QUISA|nr:Translation initiation factor eIF-2B subunit beta [Quillaja saponaria]
MPEVQVLVNEIVSKLQKRKIEGANVTARLTAELLRTVISQQKVPPTNQAAALIEVIRDIGEQLIAANPSELAVGNIVRRILFIIREVELSFVTNTVEGLKLSSEDDDIDNCQVVSAGAAISVRGHLHAPSLHALLDRTTDTATTCHPSALRDGYTGQAEKNARSSKLKRDVIEAVNELIEDINTCHEQIADHAVELIHQNEVILTLGHSRTVMEFLCAAKEKKRSFRVYVAEGAPMYQGQLLAKELVARGLQSTVITDSAVFAMISRVNMVIVGVHAVMANGGIIAPVGSNMVALAAKKHGVPYVVVVGTHKLCPLYPNNPEVLLNNMRSPSELLSFEEFSDFMDYRVGNGAPLLHVVNPLFDYVPPELVNLFITDLGGYSSSYIYNLINDYYSAEDLIMQQKY